jgi:catechol 2,3-dioxygenase-like lactoylglutathione lyase family enzyme
MANPFVHIELHTKDVEKSKKFYTGMFEWKLEEFPGMDYTIINVGEGTGGGMMKNPMPGDPDNWLPYIMVDDVAASTKEGGDARSHHCQGCHRGSGHGVVQRDYRSDRCGFWTLAVEDRQDVIFCD